jgi:hypothetical protein
METNLLISPPKQRDLSRKRYLSKQSKRDIEREKQLDNSQHEEATNIIHFITLQSFDRNRRHISIDQILNESCLLHIAPEMKIKKSRPSAAVMNTSFLNKKPSVPLRRGK